MDEELKFENVEMKMYNLYLDLGGMPRDNSEYLDDKNLYYGKYNVITQIDIINNLILMSDKYPKEDIKYKIEFLTSEIEYIKNELDDIKMRAELFDIKL